MIEDFELRGKAPCLIRPGEWCEIITDYRCHFNFLLGPIGTIFSSIKDGQRVIISVAGLVLLVLDITFLI